MLTDGGLDLIFRHARTHYAWQSKPVSDITLLALYDLFRWGPTSANCSPARVLFLRGLAAKEQLKTALAPTNVEKTMTAPVTAIIAYDLDFAEQMPKLFPHNPDAKSWFSDPAVAEITALRNGTLQGAYMIIAARALGLDCGPMSGFNNAAVDAAFFPGGRVKSNFLCNLGYGDPLKIMPRSPRLSFAEACQLL